MKNFSLRIARDCGTGIWSRVGVQSAVHRVSASCGGQVDNAWLQRHRTPSLNCMVGVGGSRRLEPGGRGGAHEVNGLNLFTDHEFNRMGCLSQFAD